jgi:Protein of unknown function (DUF1579)
MESQMEIFCDPALPPMRTTGKEHARMLGGFWLVTEAVSESTEMPCSNIITLGYHPGKGKYIGSCVDTMMSHLWLYEGAAEGNKLVLSTYGECPDKPGPVRQFREIMHLVDTNHKLYTSEILQDDGSWQTCLTIHSRRLK